MKSRQIPSYLSHTPGRTTLARFCTHLGLAALTLLVAACSSSGANSQATGLAQAQVRLAPVPGGALAPAESMMMAKDAMAPMPMGDELEAGPRDRDGFNTEEYQRINDNPFLDAKTNPLSTFSIDVDTASYSNTRRFLQENNTWPYADAVRIEELVNYFPYNYQAPTGQDPVRVGLDLAPAPWAVEHQLLRVSLKARDIPVDKLPASNLVFLLDTSGSMASPNKLPLLKQGLEILAGKLRPQDKVSIVAYAGSAGLVLQATSGDQRQTIIQAFSRLDAGGSTAGGQGIQLAYQVAREQYIRGGNNRVILCTDGDFNVGVSSTSELERLIEERRKDNIYLTVLGFGMGNYKDKRMETLADKGNGNYAYIDNLLEAKKVLGKEIWGNLFAVAKDVKIQIEFNPAKVKSWRLIGYENRLLAKEDFNDDTKDAGEMGSGHTVTAFYELVPGDGSQASTGPGPAVDPLTFQDGVIKPSDDLMVFKLRYKNPGEGDESSRLMEQRLGAGKALASLDQGDLDFRFAAAVVEFGMLLRDSPFKAGSSFDGVLARAKAAKGKDDEGYRAEFIRLVELAQLLQKSAQAAPGNPGQVGE